MFYRFVPISGQKGVLFEIPGISSATSFGFGFRTVFWTGLVIMEEINR